MERQHIGDKEAYDYYVGSIPPHQFIMGHASINEAIDHFLKHWTHSEPVPQWLDAALFRYVEDSLDEVPITRYFEGMTDDEQEQALRNILRQMNSEQLQQALSIVNEFLLADKIESMCVEAQKAGYEPVASEQVQSTANAVRSFLDEHERKEGS